MKVCIPVDVDNGSESQVYGHFGSAPTFMLVDTDSGDCRTIENRNRHHGHGMCTPLASLQGQQIDAVVVGGIGMGALNHLNAAGIQVYLAEQATVRETVEELKAGRLRAVQPNMACGHDSRGHHDR